MFLIKPLDILKNRYRVVKRLGQGSQGSVYRGNDMLLQREVVIKIADENEGKDLLSEFDLLSNLHHPNLVQTIDLVRIQKTFCLIEEYVPGLDFLSWARSHRDLIVTCRGIGAVLRGLEYLHSFLLPLIFFP